MKVDGASLQPRERRAFEVLGSEVMDPRQQA